MRVYSLAPFGGEGSMKGDVKNKLHRRRRLGIFSDIERPPCGLRGALGPDSDRSLLHRVQSGADSIGFHLSVTNSFGEHFPSF